MVEIGTVKFFDEREGKKFGFLSVPGKTDVFFHFNDRKKASIQGGEVSFASANGQAFLYPQKGAEIAFERTPARQGDKASPWTWAQSWRDAETRLQIMKETGAVIDEDLPRRNWDDLAWCHNCNRDTSRCSCICYVCYEDLADCQCVCAACGTRLPGGGLCEKDISSWDPATQGPVPDESSDIGKCATCGLPFNKTYEVERQFAGAGMSKTIVILRHHNRTSCLNCTV